MKKILPLNLGLIAILLLSFVFAGARDVKNAQDFYKKFLDNSSLYYQAIFPDRDIRGLGNCIDTIYLSEFKNYYLTHKDFIAPFAPFLKSICKPSVQLDTRYLNFPIQGLTFMENLKKIYAMIQNDIPAFIRYLQAQNLSTLDIDSADEALYFEDTINKYRYFMELLFAYPGMTFDYLFTVANHFFEFCYYDKSWPQFEQILKQKQMHPMARLLHAIIWHFFAGYGWRHWHESCIDLMKKEADKGKRFTYIAGGSDLYQLVKNGIYNVAIVDPMLPTQPKYYTGDWLWLVKGKGLDGGLGDELHFDFDGKKIIMKRTAFEKLGESFSAELHNKKVANIEKSKTTWTLFDQDSNELGNIIYHRRFCNQDDFAQSKDNVMVMSFNEVHFIASDEKDDSWGIDPSKFDKNLKLFVKQLRSPITKKELCNIRKSYHSGFSFIKLGTCVN